MDIDQAPSNNTSTSTSTSTTTSTSTRSDPVVVVEHVAGPSVGAAVALAPGRHVVGRSPTCAVRVRDAAAEPHHLALDVGRDGSVAVLQLAGRLPAIAAGQPLDGHTATELGTVVELGASRICVSRVGDRPARSAPRRLHDDTVVIRPPRRPPVLTRRHIEAPEPAPGSDGSNAESMSSTAGPMIASAIGLAGALVLAVVVGQPLFALFAVTGALATTGTWTASRVRAARRRRRATRRAAASAEQFAAGLEAIVAEARAQHLVAAPTVARAIEESWTDALWSCRPGHGDAFTVSIGTGELHVPIELVTPDGRAPEREVGAMVERAGRLDDVPITIALDRSSTEVLAVTGPLAADVVRAMVVQLAVRTGPADWRLAVVCRDAAEHEWMVRLPHALASPVGSVLDADDHAAVAAGLLSLDDGDARRLIVVTDAPGLLANRTSPLRRLLDSSGSVTVVVSTVDDTSPPAICTAVLRTGPRSTGRWQPGLGNGDGSNDPLDIRRIRVAGVDPAAARSVADSLEGLVDPEDPAAATGRLPTRVDLADVAGPVDADAVIEAWRRGGADPAPAAVVGASVDGVVELDLVRDGPHGLVAGTTGAGKSELLRTLVVALAARVAPAHLSFVLVDYKGGATFDACAALPHVVGVVTDLDDGLASRALVSLEAELHRRERFLRERRVSDLAAYRAVADVAPLARLVVIVDEFAALAGELPGFLSALVGVAQRGRSLGVHLLLATQRPAGVVDDSIRANTDLRIALRLNDESDALDVVGSSAPARFPRGVPGRALVRLGQSEAIEIQAAVCPDDAVDEIVAAAERSGAALPHRPWLPPLSEVGIDDVPTDDDGADPDDVIGVVDDPASQRRLPLRWDRRGNLALVGAIGTGTTSTLVAIGTGALADPDTHLYVLDAHGDPALAALEASDRCAGVIGVDDRERVERVLVRLCGEIDRRRGTRVRSGPDRVLLIDGVVALRRSLDDTSLGESSAALDRVLAEGPAVGVVVAAVLEVGGGAMATLAPRFAERWVFDLDDPADAQSLGIRGARRRGSRRVVPGRLTIASSGLEAQVLAGLPVAGLPVGGATADAEPVSPIRSLPAIVSVDEVRAGEVRVSSSTAGDLLRLPIGIGYDSLDPAVLEVPAGEHVLVVGPARSGRTTALRRLAAAWASQRPDGRMVEIDRSIPTTWPDANGTPLLIVVDDAERVDDRDGVLASLVDSGRDEILVIAAGRPESLRSSYGHWTGVVRRSRVGLVMAAGTDLDGDLIGAAIPRRCPIAVRPGLAWLADGAGVRLAQVAIDQRSMLKPAR